MGKGKGGIEGFERVYGFFETLAALYGLEPSKPTEKS
jgi:hypothetical protein